MPPWPAAFAGHAPYPGDPGGHRRRHGARLPGADVFDRPDNTLGVRHYRRRGALLQLLGQPGASNLAGCRRTSLYLLSRRRWLLGIPDGLLTKRQYCSIAVLQVAIAGCCHTRCSATASGFRPRAKPGQHLLFHPWEVDPDQPHVPAAAGNGCATTPMSRMSAGPPAVRLGPDGSSVRRTARHQAARQCRI